MVYKYKIGDIVVIRDYFNKEKHNGRVAIIKSLTFLSNLKHQRHKEAYYLNIDDEPFAEDYLLSIDDKKLILTSSLKEDDKVIVNDCFEDVIEKVIRIEGYSNKGFYLIKQKDNSVTCRYEYEIKSYKEKLIKECYENLTISDLKEMLKYMENNQK